MQRCALRCGWAEGVRRRRMCHGGKFYSEGSAGRRWRGLACACMLLRCCAMMQSWNAPACVMRHPRPRVEWHTAPRLPRLLPLPFVHHIPRPQNYQSTTIIHSRSHKSLSRECSHPTQQVHTIIHHPQHTTSLSPSFSPCPFLLNHHSTLP